MTGPYSLLRSAVRRAVQAAYGAEHAAVDPAVHRSQFADYQADVALRLAKPLRQKPLDIAQAIASKLELAGVADVSVSPPGFVNFRFAASYLETELARLAADERCGVPAVEKPETIVIDYSAPNVAKEMHAGHLRSTVIGDALARTLRFVGHRTILQNHIGDWGTNFGMLIEHLNDLGRDAAIQELSLGSLNEFYQAARKKFDQDPEFTERSRKRVVLLQAGDATTLDAWRTITDASRHYFSRAYERLGILLRDEDVRGESFYNPFLSEIADDLEKRGIARVDQGALCVFPPGFFSRDKEPLPLIIRKQDGGFGYAATDLAALRYRVRDLAANRVLYVVGAEQQQHFAMVFAAARMAGYVPPEALAEHVTFGFILGPDKKKFKSREGGSVKLASLVDEAVERARQAVRSKNPDLPEDVVATVATQVGCGALKYVDLSSDRIKDYVFDWDRMLAFEGNTGPYLQYAHARIRSIERKAESEGLGIGVEKPALSLQAAQERALALELLDLELMVTSAAEALQPHRLCSYLYDLAGSFTSFYDACPVLKAESDELRKSRLLLCAATRRTLALGLSLLGIVAPERM
jgi:arginyl-tRNA synthetase